MALGVFIKKDKQVVPANEIGFDEGKETRLENLIIDNPEIFPVTQISENSSLWIPVSKQLHVVTGHPDTLGVDGDGGIYIIENKLDSNNDKKTVRQQVRDYAHAFRQLKESKEGWKMFLDKIENANKSDSKDIKERKFYNKDLKKILDDEDDVESDELMSNIKRNFDNGVYTLVVAIDRISKKLRVSIDGENELDGKILRMFALEVKEYEGSASNEKIIVTSTYPYDLEELKRKSITPRFQNNEKTFDEQFNKSKLTLEQKEIFKNFHKKLVEIASEITFNEGNLASILPKFEVLENRSPISLYAKGDLILQFDMIGPFAKLHSEFMSQINAIPDIVSAINRKKSKKYPRFEPEEWMPHSEKILGILEQIFVKPLNTGN